MNKLKRAKLDIETIVKKYNLVIYPEIRPASFFTWLFQRIIKFRYVIKIDFKRQ